MMRYFYNTRILILGICIVAIAVPASAQDTTANLAQNSTLDWSAENEYWQSQFDTRPYSSGNNYASYQSAYQFGFNAYAQYGGKPYQDIDEVGLKDDWQHSNVNSILTWLQAKPAIIDAYQHMYDYYHTPNPPPISPSPSPGM